MATTLPNEELLYLYTQIAGDSYGPSKPLEFNNELGNGWQKVPLGVDSAGNKIYYEDINGRGCDIAIYYNEYEKTVIVGIRGTEVSANDGDLFESAKILTKDSNLTQFNVLKDLQEKIETVLSTLELSEPSYKIVGQSLGGALATAYISEIDNTNSKYTCSEVICINPIGVEYKYSKNVNVTNYMAMNDIFAMYSYDEQIGAIKLVFPVSMRDWFNSIQIVVSANPVFSSFIQTITNKMTNSLDPHNAVIFKENVAEYFSQNILELDSSKWSREKGLAIWYYDKDNAIVQNGFINLGTFAGIASMFSSLKRGECILLGDSVIMPTRIRIDVPNPKPSSDDISFYEEWSKPHTEKNIELVLDAWRRQQVSEGEAL